MLPAHQRRLTAWLAAAAFVANALVGPAAHAMVMRDASGAGSDFCSANKPPLHEQAKPDIPAERTPGHHGNDCVCHGGGSGIVQAAHCPPPFVVATPAGAIAVPEEQLEGTAPGWPVSKPRPPPRSA